MTAQKRALSLSDVSLSVSAVGAEELAANTTVTLEGLQALVLSISFGNDFNFAKLFIRAIGGTLMPPRTYVVALGYEF